MGMKREPCFLQSKQRAQQEHKKRGVCYLHKQAEMEGIMKIGFIGIGNMGGAILKGYVKAAIGNEKNIYAFDADRQKLTSCQEELGIGICESVEALVETCQLVVMAVKPNIYDLVLPEIKRKMNEEKIILSVAAGISMAYIEKSLGLGTKVVRVMPNTPALVNEGMTAIFKNAHVEERAFSEIVAMLETIGKVQLLEESLIHTVIGVSGSSPAYVYMFIQALIEGAVKNGMDREQAKIFAAQSVLGAAKMVLETGEAPTKLRDDVCSPGGTTIEAVTVLQNNGFEEKTIEGMVAAIEKSKRMTK